MNIAVIDCDWGGALPSDIEMLLTGVASHLTVTFREIPKGNIVVGATSSPDDNPVTLFRSCQEEPFTMPITQSIPKATVFVGSGIVSVLGNL